MTEIDNYLRANSILEVFQLFDSLTATQVKILCGGTDLFLKLRNGEAPNVTLIDISEIPDMIGIREYPDAIRIGAGTKLSDVAKSDVLSGSLRILADGALQVGSRQIRNLASIGGNICNAAPSADTAAPLVALDAEVEILSRNNERRLAASAFFKGPGQTALEHHELLSAIWIPKPPQKSSGIYIKHCVRGAMELALVGVAVVLWKVKDAIEGRITLGSVAPTPIRAHKAEAKLHGLNSFDPESLEAVAEVAAQEIKPISDVRASAWYRKDMTHQLTKRALCQAYQALLDL